MLATLGCGAGQAPKFKSEVEVTPAEDSSPYFHDGSKLRLEDVAQFYINSLQLARKGLLRNPPPEFESMSISQEDIDALTAFLLSLTEDL